MVALVLFNDQRIPINVVRRHHHSGDLCGDLCGDLLGEIMWGK